MHVVTLIKKTYAARRKLAKQVTLFATAASSARQRCSYGKRETAPQWPNLHSP